MNQPDIDQKNTNALIATAVMYQKQRNNLLAACEAVVAWVKAPAADRMGQYGHFLDDILPQLEAAIAAAKEQQ